MFTSARRFFGQIVWRRGIKQIPNELEQEIYKIHKSTKTLFKFFNPLHNKLMHKFRWYNKWHLHPYHRHVHYSALAVAVVACVAVVFTFTFAQKTHATGSTIAVTDTTGATVINTGAKIYFSPDTYHSNVTIDNFTRQMSGYAWSTDLGWIDFANTGSSPANPVKADRTGHLSGKAKAINGGYIDFAASPTGSNVAISGGVFSGFAWSDDLGWIDFSGVTAPGYNPDLLPPDNSTLSSALNANGGSTPITTNNYYNFPNPSFSWTVPTDYANGITPAGITGYLVYFGTDNTANITLTDSQVALGANNGLYTWQSGTTFTNAATLATNTTYYLKVIAIDGGGNPFYSATSSTYNLFVYNYDITAPSKPTHLSVEPDRVSHTNYYAFSWTASTDLGGIRDYQYNATSDDCTTKQDGWINTNSVDTSIALNNIAYQNNRNTLCLRAIDTAGNASPTSQIDFIYSGNNPGAPTSLTVTPSDTSLQNPSTENNFAFSWTAPEHFTNIKQYHYSINTEPDESNAIATITPVTSLSAGSYATKQGKNTFYIVSEDTDGNIDYSLYAKVDFYATTIAPGIPGLVQVSDISNRDAKRYSVALEWNIPDITGSDFDGYEVYRSLDNQSFTKIGTTSSTIYADGGLESKIYYYYVRSKDKVGQFSPASSLVSITPTGRFTSAPKLVSGPTVTVSPTSITVKWATDRACSSFVEIKDGNTFVSEQGQTEQTTNHEVKVVGLRSQRDYTYNIRSTDVDNNSLVGDEQKFTTANTPSVYDLNVSNITQQTAILNFKSTAVANFTLYYGETPSFGTTISESSNTATTNHSLALSELKPGTIYFFRVVGDDADGNELRSENTFSTLPMPAVSKFSIQPDKSAPSTTLNMSWITNVPTTSTVKYSTDGITFSEKSTSDLVTEHEIVIADLKDSNKYTIYASGRDQFGNVAESEKVSFDTPIDTRAPKVTNIVIESSNVGNQTTTAQVAVSWKTDEPANSQIEYGTGLTGGNYTNKTIIDGTYSNNHLVIITGLDPSKPYHLRVLTADMAGNLTQSGDNTVITGEVSHSALQIILTTLTNVFGWMGRIIHQ